MAKRNKIAQKALSGAMERLRETIPSYGNPLPGHLAEMAAKFQDCVDDEAHLERVTEWLVETCRTFPSVAEILQAVKATAKEPTAQDFVATGCDVCEWTGYVITERAGISGAAPCACLTSGRMQIRPDDWYQQDRATREDLAKTRGEIGSLVQTARELMSDEVKQA